MRKYNIKPVSAPRQNNSDRWKVGENARPCVAKYRSFKDNLRLTNINVENGGTVVIFAIKMPKSWPNNKKLAMIHQPHDQKPDIDNLCKALMDGLMKEDKTIYNIIPFKFWSDEDAIYIDHTKPKTWDELIKKATD